MTEGKKNFNIFIEDLAFERTDNGCYGEWKDRKEKAIQDVRDEYRYEIENIDKELSVIEVIRELFKDKGLNTFLELKKYQDGTYGIVCAEDHYISYQISEETYKLLMEVIK